MEVKDILRTERKAYPSQFWMMQDCLSKSDIAEYCECQEKDLLILGNKTWYALLAKERQGKAEFVDLAKQPSLKFLPWVEILESLKGQGIKEIRADLRTSTSFKILKHFSKRFGIYFLKEKHYFDDFFGEEMVEVIISFTE